MRAPTSAKDWGHRLAADPLTFRAQSPPRECGEIPHADLRLRRVGMRSNNTLFGRVSRAGAARAEQAARRHRQGPGRFRRLEKPGQRSMKR